MGEQRTPADDPYASVAASLRQAVDNAAVK